MLATLLAVVADLHTEGPGRRGLRLLRVRGRSMLPTLREGDLLLARTARSARPGQVVVVDWLDGQRPLSVKRLLRRDPDGWWVERDNPREGTDSWAAGAVPPAGLRAVVLLRLWPRPGRVPGPPPGPPGR